ncbi:zinc ABC transporter substrate-binding protein AztC [Leucobacter luti]|uniref:Zinc/manganese transport system substrate-binding protein n=1 Tax=Leucobacter luti TaxID=340320 RepID=A0A4Q7TPI1_9MICO|nr:zinc ABC transporter substrate-binding protein AztC [Leucobacter luti]MBL3699983.1 zinc ABC transporter substrate-binding protein [Leucobacter luti]RZT62701.1 zinc/manganese transport system substrate-binding protein [Leucobacter luti]
MSRSPHRMTLAALALIVPLLTGCTAVAEDASPQVVVTTNILGDVVERIAGDEAAVTTLMKPNADPHSFEISAQEAARLESAALIVANGLGLEEGLQQHLDRAEALDVPTVIAGDHIEVLSYAAADAGGTDAGDTADPHFWTDPARMGEVVDAIAAALAATDGVDPAAIRANATAYRAELARLDADMTAAFAAIPPERRALVTNHHVFGYLAERFDFTVVGAAIPGGTTLAAPSAADLRDLAAAIDTARVPTIFAESSQPDRLMQVLAEEAGIRVDVVELFTESLTAPGEGADTYLTMMRSNTARIATGLTP